MKNFLIILFLFSFQLLSAQVTFTATDVTAECDGTFEIDIVVTNFTAIQSMQFTLDWSEEYLVLDTSTMQIQGGFGGYGTPNEPEGYINFAWGFLSPTAINDGTAILTLTFSVLNGYTGNDATLTLNGTQTNLIIQGLNGVTINDYVINPSTITIIDSTPPTLTCPDSISLTTSGGPLQIPNLTPTAFDNCNITSITYLSTGDTELIGDDDASNSFFNVGETILTYTVTDGGNNSLNCSTIITITEDVLPSDLSFDFSDINISCEQDSFSIDLNVTGFVDMTSITMPITFDETIMSFSSYTVQNINASNASVGSLQANNGILNFAWFDNPGQDVDDNLSILTLNFQVIHAGINSIDFDIPNTVISNMDGIISNNDIIYGTGNVIIFDDEAPNIECPEDINITSVSNDLTNVPGLNPTINDNCSIETINYVLTGGVNDSGLGELSNYDFPIGTTNLEYTVNDYGENSVSCNFDITVSDSPNNGDLTFILSNTIISCENTTISIPISVTNFTEVTSFQFSLNWDNTLFNYDINIDTLIVNSAIIPGLTSVGEDLASDGKITLAWVDNVSPVGLTLQNNTTIGVLTITSLGNNTGTIDFTSDPTPIIASNTSGIINNDDINFLSGSISVIDTVAPTMVCPDNLIFDIQGGNCMTTVMLVEPQVEDNCSDNIILTASTNQTIFGIGTHPIVYTATDEDGNSSTCTYDVIVTNIQDIPQFTSCPSDTNIVLTNSCETQYSWIAPQAISFCDNDLNVQSNYTPGQIFEIGQHNVVYIATNDSGNADTCAFTINVVDENIPMMNDCPVDYAVNLPTGECTTPIIIPFIYGSTACQDTIIATPIIPVLTAYNPGTYAFEYEIISNSGLRDTCSFNVTVNGNTSTTMTNCPTDTTIYISQDSCMIFHEWVSPSYTNSCEGVNVTSNFDPQNFSAGVYNILIEGATTFDTIQCSFSVTVLDTFPLAVSNCTNDTILYLNQDSCSIYHQWTNPTFVNSCENVDITSNIDPQNFGPGVYNIIVEGNTTLETAQCSFSLTVLDTLAPIFDVCPSNVEISIGGEILSDASNVIDSFFVNNSCDSIQIYYSDLTAEDNCIANVSQSIVGGLTSGSWYPIGTSNQTFTAADTSNNVANCTFDITVSEPSLIVEITDNIVCAGEMVTINAISNGNLDGVIWSGPETLIDINNTINAVTSNQAGIYSVEAQLANGCNIGPAVDTLVVVENVITADDAIITVDGLPTTFNLFENDVVNTDIPYTFSIISNPSNGSVIDNGNGSITYTPNIEYIGQDEFAYEVCYTLCNTMCSNAIVIIDNQNTNITCQVPTLITPNGDGFNDALFIQCLENNNHSNNILRIYNQWGDEVYKAEPYLNDTPWKGTYKDKDLPDAVYFYIFQESESAEKLRGTITIYR